MRGPGASELRKPYLPSSTSTWQAGSFRHRLSGEDTLFCEKLMPVAWPRLADRDVVTDARKFL